VSFGLEHLHEGRDGIYGQPFFGVCLDSLLDVFRHISSHEFSNQGEVNGNFIAAHPPRHGLSLSLPPVSLPEMPVTLAA
jgi:hypothetical protein